MKDSDVQWAGIWMARAERAGILVVILFFVAGAVAISVWASVWLAKVLAATGKILP